MRKITPLIFVFFIAAGLLGGVHLAFALDPKESIREIKAIAEADGLYEYVIDKTTDKFIEVSKDKLKRQKPEVYEGNGTRDDSRFVLAGIGGTTLDPQPGPLKIAPPETPKERGILPPAEPLTPESEPQGVGAVPPPSVVTPGEVPRRGQLKEETGSQKPAASKETRKKRKEKGKTTAERASTAKRVKPRSQKKVEKSPETSTGRARKPGKHPTAVSVTKSLDSQGKGQPAPKPETKGPATPSTKKKESGQSGTTQR